MATGGALYDHIGAGYSRVRRPDPRIEAIIGAALGPSRTVLNVGAGAGAYEPPDRSVVAVEPSEGMIGQRPLGAAPVVRACAESLPFRRGSFDAVLAILTIHHWTRREQGLAEMRQVARDRVIVVTWDPGHAGFWLVQDYFPEILEIDRSIFPSLNEMGKLLGPLEVRAIPVPSDCSDGFLGAYWRRPAAYLDARVRGAISTFSRLKDTQAGFARLRSDLEDGTWGRRHAALTALSSLDIGYRLVIARR